VEPRSAAVNGAVTMTHRLRFLLGGLLGFALAVPAGILQADLGLNLDSSELRD
jgi:hypothetical protein